MIDADQGYTAEHGGLGVKRASPCHRISPNFSQYSPGIVITPTSEMIEHDVLGGEIARQYAPLATRPAQVEASLENYS